MDQETAEKLFSANPENVPAGITAGGLGSRLGWEELSESWKFLTPGIVKPPLKSKAPSRAPMIWTPHHAESLKSDVPKSQLL